jgi:hypothetical protein
MIFQILLPGKESNWEETCYFFLPLLWIVMMHLILNQNFSLESIRKQNFCTMTKVNYSSNPLREKASSAKRLWRMRGRYPISQSTRHEIHKSREDMKKLSYSSTSQTKTLMFTNVKNSCRNFPWSTKYSKAISETLKVKGVTLRNKRPW